MNTALVMTSVVAGAVLVFYVAVRLPLRMSTLDRLKPAKWFHGLILFGRSGAYIQLDQRSSQEVISFTKTLETGEQWLLEIKLSGPSLRASLVDEIRSDIASLGERFNLQDAVQEGGGQVRMVFDGPGLRDHLALEGLARLLIRRMGHRKDAKYGLTFAGLKDYEAFNRYYGFKR